MTCKDCFHFKVCDSGRHIGEYIEDDGIYSEGVEKECITFIASADVVEVVRCKDCIHAREFKHRGEVIEGIYRCSYLKPNTNMFDVDYCRYGKRRDKNAPT